MHDPATGRTRADRALGEDRYKPQGVPTDLTRSKQFGYYGIRDENVGVFGGPRGRAQRYSVSEAAKDVLNKKGRSK